MLHNRSTEDSSKKFSFVGQKSRVSQPSFFEKDVAVNSPTNCQDNSQNRTKTVEPVNETSVKQQNPPLSEVQKSPQEDKVVFKLPQPIVKKSPEKQPNFQLQVKQLVTPSKRPIVTAPEYEYIYYFHTFS